MLPTKFWFIWPSGFRGEDLLENNQSETRIACGSHVCQRIDWSISKKSSPLKQLVQMNRNLVGSIYGRSSIKVVHFGSIR
jgi:hypothetical protein